MISGDLRPDSLFFFTAKSRRSSLPVRHRRNRFLKPSLWRQQKCGNAKTVKQGMGREAEEGFWRTCAKQLGSNLGHQTEWYQGEMCVRWSFRNIIWPSKPCQPSVIETYIYPLSFENCASVSGRSVKTCYRGGALCDKPNYKESDWLDFQSQTVHESFIQYHHG